ncbi:MerR family transcriptional regulator [Collinsella intestinalis]|uniref:MerR family transcriptional regulator n=1 Tax=Collinsella intestinalis TaxID=147207 RepID=UPI00195872BA|nr:MerR family transcriptional regulator [Collinsella intestinalis]MBM6942580.1 MerR family transcriptional regulator [Collinsella intestinalis]
MVKAKAERDDVYYAVGQLAELAGVSTRTLRYYEEEGLLRPSRSANGYRVYTARDAKRLASILSMRACGLSVATIHRLLARAEGDLRHVLHAHLLTLSAQRDSLDEAIDRTKAAIASLERIEQMNESDAFEALKGEKIAANERTYGKEARARWGDDAVDAANERMRSASRGEWDALERLGEEINRQLALAMETGDPSGAEAMELARMHARWIQGHWGAGRYSPEAHRGLAQMYLADDRFRAHYDGAAGAGATEFLVKALEAYLA